MNDSLHALLIDDNPDDRALVIRELRREFPGLKTEEVADLSSFLKVLESAAFDLAITDYQLRWTDGLAILRSVKARWPECPVIMFTGSGSEEVAVEAMKAGLDDYVPKSPKHYARLPGTARLVLKLAKQKRQLREADRERERLILELQEALAKVRTLGGLLPICAACKKIRDDTGYWNQIELFIQSHSDAEFTHSLCPDCTKALYPEVFNPANQAP